MPSFNKLHRGVCLALFTIAGAYSLYNPHVFKTAALALIGVIAYDIVCYLKAKSEVKDYGPEIEKLAATVSDTNLQIKEMKNDVSVAKLAHTFRGK